MKQETYDMESSANKNNINNLNIDINSFGGDKNIQRFYPSKQGKENQNSLSYKLREIKENQNKLQMNNNINNISNTSKYMNNSNEQSINNSNAIINQSQITNQSKYSKYKNSNSNFNNINNFNYNNSNSNINNMTGNNSTISNNSNNRKNSRQKNSSSTAQIDEQYEMQKLLELENKSANKYKENMYKKIKERENLKNNIPINKGYHNYNNYNMNNNINNNVNSEGIDKNIKNYIDEQAEKIKEFIHEEINNLHVDLIRQFEIQNIQNKKLFQQFSDIQSQMCQEIQRLKNENELLKKSIVK